MNHFKRLASYICLHYRTSGVGRERWFFHPPQSDSHRVTWYNLCGGQRTREVSLQMPLSNYICPIYIHVINYCLLNLKQFFLKISSSWIYNVEYLMYIFTLNKIRPYAVTRQRFAYTVLLRFVFFFVQDPVFLCWSEERQRNGSVCVQY